ncbi:hypothetical protein HMPREF0201_02964 [Cedecea davisae DSM 4568]|uniref:Uncharacterized protein n=1 Tax=Cedecea davisae DSM 4568 TaxID=566551 RepID=S3IRW7_9ENTR|nr:hypothetical protein HMPREF0201_02964 [Cedecea davisae DSM 4568]
MAGRGQLNIKARQKSPFSSMINSRCILANALIPFRIIYVHP